MNNINYSYKSSPLYPTIENQQIHCKNQSGHKWTDAQRKALEAILERNGTYVSWVTEKQKSWCLKDLSVGNCRKACTELGLREYAQFAPGRLKKKHMWKPLVLNLILNIATDIGEETINWQRAIVVHSCLKRYSPHRLLGAIKSTYARYSGKQKYRSIQGDEIDKIKKILTDLYNKNRGLIHLTKFSNDFKLSLRDVKKIVIELKTSGDMAIKESWISPEDSTDDIKTADSPAGHPAAPKLSTPSPSFVNELSDEDIDLLDESKESELSDMDSNGDMEEVVLPFNISPEHDDVSAEVEMDQHLDFDFNQRVDSPENVDDETNELPSSQTPAPMSDSDNDQTAPTPIAKPRAPIQDINTHTYTDSPEFGRLPFPECVFPIAEPFDDELTLLGMAGLDNFQNVIETPLDVDGFLEFSLSPPEVVLPPLELPDAYQYSNNYIT